MLVIRGGTRRYNLGAIWYKKIDVRGRPPKVPLHWVLSYHRVLTTQ